MMSERDPTGGVQSRLERSTLLFVHIPKTAGTTFQTILRKLYSEQDRCELYPSWWVAKAGLELHTKRDRFRAVGGHFTYGVHAKPEIRPFLADDMHYITILRDPVHRVVSTFNHLLSSDYPEHRTIIAKHPTLEAYLKHRSARNAQTWFITGSKESPSNAPQGRGKCRDRAYARPIQGCRNHRRFDESLVLFAKKFGWGLPTYVPQNLARSRVLRLSVEDLDDSLIERIRDINRCDIAIYEHACSMFDASWSKHPALRSTLREYRSRLTAVA